MKIIYNSLIPPKGFAAINLFGVLFARHGVRISQRLVNHEAIHTAQMKPLLYVFFYLLYVLEWLVRFIQYRDAKKAYFAISFEREAYQNDTNIEYNSTRKKFDWINYY